MPIQQEPIEDAKDRLLPGPFLYCFLQLSDQLGLYLRIHWQVFLFVEVVVAAMVWWDLARLLDSSECMHETVPRDGTCGCIPVLDTMYWMDGDVFHRLEWVCLVHRHGSEGGEIHTGAKSLDHGLSRESLSDLEMRSHLGV